MKIKKVFNLDEMKGNIYFMSDLHIGHENVIQFDHRPFSSIQEMNDSIVKDLQTKLKPEDVLFDLGDMFWEVPWITCKSILDSIPVEKLYECPGNHHIAGNYYGPQARLSCCFTELADIFDIIVVKNKKTYRLSLSHFPIIDWNHKARGGLMIHGHCHGQIDKFNSSSPALRVDVGYSSKLAKENGSFLVPFDKILDHFYKKTNGREFFDWATDTYTDFS